MILAVLFPKGIFIAILFGVYWSLHVGVHGFFPCHSFVTIKNIRSRTPILFAEGTPIVVALTREDGKNLKLNTKILETKSATEDLETVELPCIEHAKGPDYERLSSSLVSKQWDYIAITSPEAAKVLASAWDVVRDNPIPVVAVGKATEKSLRDADISVSFVPSKATAATLANELKLVSGESQTSVLYPASAKARNVLEDGLRSRGFSVTRMNTYDTGIAKWSNEQRNCSQQVKVACFASPSAVEGWVKNSNENTRVVAACIGETSASACRELGWDEDRIFFPEKPGLDGWVEAIKRATEVVIKDSS